MFLISTLFNSICLHKFSHHLSIMMILPAIKSNLCNPLKENCKNMQSSNYTSYRVICKHRRVVSQIEGDGNISNLIIIAIVQHDDNVDGSPQILSVGVTGWRNDEMTEWLNDELTDWVNDWLKLAWQHAYCLDDTWRWHFRAIVRRFWVPAIRIRIRAPLFVDGGTFIGCMPCRLLARVRVASPYMNICGNSYEFSGVT